MWQSFNCEKQLVFILFFYFLRTFLLCGTLALNIFLVIKLNHSEMNIRMEMIEEGVIHLCNYFIKYEQLIFLKRNSFYFLNIVFFLVGTAYYMCESAMLSQTSNDEHCPSQAEDVTEEPGARNDSLDSSVTLQAQSQSLTDEVYCAKHYEFTDLIILLVGWYYSSYSDLNYLIHCMFLENKVQTCERTA